MTTEKEITVDEIKVEEGLVIIPQGGVLTLFNSEETIRKMVERIRQEVTGHEVDLSTAKGRKEIASRAYSVSKSKTRLDNIGKEQVAEIKKKTGLIDSSRKIARDELDALRDEVRKPLTDWETEQERLAQEEQRKHEEEQERLRLEAEILQAHDDANNEDELRVLRKEKEERDRLEQERLEKEQSEKAEADRKEREAREKKELEERLRLEAEEKAEREKQEEIDRIQREADEKIKAEKDRLQQIEDDRIAKEKREKHLADLKQATEDKKAENKRHQSHVNRKAMKALVDAINCSEDQAKDIVKAIATGQIPSVSIKY